MSAMKAGRSNWLKLARVPLDIGRQFLFRSLVLFQLLDITMQKLEILLDIKIIDLY